MFKPTGLQGYEKTDTHKTPHWSPLDDDSKPFIIF